MRPPNCPPWVIAHRGWSGRYPENTLAAIRAAIRLGVDMVEIDVQQTRDGELVVFHDDRLERVYGVPKRVRDATRREMPGAPTLGQVLRVCRGKTRVLVEIKGANGRQVARVIERGRMVSNVIVFSFNPRRIAEVAAVNRRIRRFGLTARRLSTRVPVDGWGVSRQLVTTRAVVERFHRRGWKVFVWTVNRRDEMRRLAAWGVSGIITDHPDRALGQRADVLKRLKGQRS